MKKQYMLIVILVGVLVVSLPAVVSASWGTHSSEDQMTGEKMYFASSKDVGATEKMGFPYDDTRAWLSIGNDGDDEWVYIGFTNQPNLTNTSLEDGYEVINTRIKWNDNDIEETRLIQSWGAKFTHFSDDEYIISKIESSNTLLIELNWYGEGKVYFEFPLNGSAQAISEIRDKAE